jgi:hypothetical protein
MVLSNLSVEIEVQQPVLLRQPNVSGHENQQLHCSTAESIRTLGAALFSVDFFPILLFFIPGMSRRSAYYRRDLFHPTSILQWHLLK